MLSLTPFNNHSPSFEQPLEMLQACHDKIRRFCTLLEKMPAYVAVHGVDESVRNTANSIIRHFDLAAPAHHMDEEDDLFPMLLAHNAEHAVLLEQLMAEHSYLCASWEIVRSDLLSLLAGEITLLNQNELTDFARQYTEHMQEEESWLFPAIAAAFSTQELSAAGQRMAARRQQTM